MSTTEYVYIFELDYDKVDFTVDTVMKQLDKWKENFGACKVSYIITDEVLWILGIFKARNKRLKIYLQGWRHAKILCGILWIKYDQNKYKYQKDLFHLDFL